MTRLRKPPGALRRALDRLDGDAVSLFGSSRLSVLEWQDRPFSYLARLGVTRDGEAAPFTYLFLKVFKSESSVDARDRMRERVIRDFETTRGAFEAMQSYPDLGAVPPLVCYPDELTIVTTQIDGVTLLDYLYDRTRWVKRNLASEIQRTMGKVGHWIRAFQTTGTADGVLTADSFRDYIDSRLVRLVEGSPAFSQGDRQRVLLHIDALWSAVDASQRAQVPIHADMALGNVLVSGSRIVVLDFAMARFGGRHHDVARLFVQVDLLTLKPQLRRSVIALAQAALLDGFDCSLRRDQPLFRLHELLHRINHFASLTLKKHPFPESVYNMVVRRRHRAWLERELSTRPI